MAGEPAFFELGVEDDEKGRAFYANLFGWDFRPGPNQGYEISTTGLPGARSRTARRGAARGARR